MDLTQISQIERNLTDFFHPIDPDPQFIDTLSHRLSQTDRTMLDRTVPAHNIWAAIGIGLTVGIVIWWLLGGRSKR